MKTNPTLTPRPTARVTREGERQIIRHLEELHIHGNDAIFLVKAYERQLRFRLQRGEDARIIIPAHNSKTKKVEHALIDHHGWSTEPYVPPPRAEGQPDSEPLINWKQEKTE